MTTTLTSPTPNASPSAATGDMASSLRAPRVTKRRAETRHRLLDAALAVFAERGFGASSVEDVCERAGYTRGAFYSNFRTMDELFGALYERQSERLVARFREVVLAPLDDPEQGASDPVEEAVDRFLAAHAVDPAWALVTMEFLLHAARNDAAAARLAALRHQLRDELSPLLSDALQRAGRAPTVPAERLARVLIAMSEGALVQTLAGPDAVAHDELGRLALPCLVRGLSTPLPSSEEGPR